MAFTLTQARVLLTAAELAIFDQSRAGPVKELTAVRLRAKVTRARALRDKYRDLYRRQTVATRGARADKRSAAGGDNERTQKKATVFTEVLERFEARLAQLDAAEARQAKGSRSPGTGVAAASKTARPGKARKKTTKPLSLKTAVKQALELKHAALAVAPVADHSAKAPAALSPLASAAAGTAPLAAPLDINPRAARLNPLKERAENIALHAHSGSQNRRAQGKRDSR